MSLRVGFDIDGVLADFRTAFRDTSRSLSRRAVDEGPTDPEQPPDGMSAADVQRVWRAIERTPQWWLRLKPYEPSEIDRLYHLSRERLWEVYFLTTRPPSAGETPQFQTQWWLEANGFHLPAVLTVPGSRGDLANALRLDALVDDRLLNCMDVIAASNAKAIYLMRDNDVAGREQALARGIAVVTTLQAAVDAVLQIEDAIKAGRSRLARLADWFKPRVKDERLPMNPRDSMSLPEDS